VKWWRFGRKGNGKAAAEVEAVKELRATKGQRSLVERRARELAELPADEFADEVTRMFRRRPA
jgi:hypothetical protein